jgi:hypothetical protein
VSEVAAGADVPEQHRLLMRAAIECEARAQRAALAGDRAASEAAFREAAAGYRASWEVAPPASYGRLVGMLKAAVLGGDAEQAARYARAEIGESAGGSPTAAYALAIAALVLGDDASAAASAQTVRQGSDAFARAADAIEALARRQQSRYDDALSAIVADFEGRAEHLTGVPIADTALMLERLAAARGLSGGARSALLPADW